MPGEERDPAYLWDIVQAARKAIELLQRHCLEGYLLDEDVCLVVERRLEIMGEAARRVSSAFKARHPEVPWALMVGQRNVMAHQYDEIDHERVWNTVQRDLPEVVRLLTPLLPPEPGSDDPT